MPDFPNHFENLDEANFRLKETVITYDGKPAYVHRVGQLPNDDILRCYITMLPCNLERAMIEAEDEDDRVPNGVILRKKINSPKFNRFRPFPMGFANVFDEGFPHATLLSRVPVRRSSQGLCSQALSQTVPALQNQKAQRNFHKLVASDGFTEMVTGEYPSVQEVLDTVREDSSIAFAREAMIQRSRRGFDYLYVNKDCVALLRRGTILIPPKYSYIREKLQDIPALRNIPLDAY